jgi:hypothetical protein
MQAGFADEQIAPRKDQILIEPDQHGPKLISVLANIITLSDALPPVVKAKVIKIGELTQEDVGFMVGDDIMVVPHGGSLIPTEEGKPIRMVLPISQVLGVWED